MNHPLLIRLIRTILLTLLAFSLAAAQEYGVIRGRVYDKASKSGLPSANVMVKGTYYGAASDIDGSFIIPKVGR